METEKTLSPELKAYDPANIKPLVVIESPYAGDIESNLAYGRAAVRDSVLRGEAPAASHLLFTQPGILRDDIEAERELGMGIGWHVMRRANYVAVYPERGWSSGMIRGVRAALDAGKSIRVRSLGGAWAAVAVELFSRKMAKPMPEEFFPYIRDGKIIVEEPYAQ